MYVFRSLKKLFTTGTFKASIGDIQMDVLWALQDVSFY